MVTTTYGLNRMDMYSLSRDLDLQEMELHIASQESYSVDTMADMEKAIEQDLETNNKGVQK